MLIDAAGNLFGTAGAGGPLGHGEVFELAAVSHDFKILGSFDGENGDGPFGGMVHDAAGNLYGTTFAGGPFGKGVIYRLSGTGFVV